MLRRIAEQECVSLDYVVKSIEQAGREAYLMAKICGDVRTMAMWDRIPRTGEFPNAVEIIAYMGEKYRR